ncbi:pectinesterase 63 [Pyrus ussuriensis x Pyrus communis]|uniref:Pectinesterase 63 n=1 Tax=Pyrus ussuriensis x Pyrus communis TaxID=2448454 RepID=A0A5N5F5X0_9ROSA|nr:pectinesterase 63 [Pyrus ussuriensis x Pyrus communis]
MMAGHTTCMFIYASLMIITILLTSSAATIADDTIPIPSDGSQVASWFDNNVKTYNERKSKLDPALVASEHAPQVIKVSLAKHLPA